MVIHIVITSKEMERPLFLSSEIYCVMYTVCLSKVTEAVFTPVYGD